VKLSINDALKVKPALKVVKNEKFITSKIEKSLLSVTEGFLTNEKL